MPISTTVRAGAAQPQGRRLHRRLEQDQDLRPAAPARPVLRRARPISGSSSCPPRRTSPSPKNICSAEVGVRYTNTRKSLGGVDHEKGIAWRVIGGADHAEGDSFPAHLGRDRLWRAAAARRTARPGSMRRPASSAGRSESPLGSLLFRQRSATTMSITGRRNGTARWRASRASRSTRSPRASFAKLTGEVNLPPMRFAEVGTPAFFLSYARPALFAGAMLLRIIPKARLPAIT